MRIDAHAQAGTEEKERWLSRQPVLPLRTLGTLVKVAGMFLHSVISAMVLAISMATQERANSSSKLSSMVELCSAVGKLPDLTSAI